MHKITAEHLARDAYVYVRQSTVDQLLNNPESRRRQYALVEAQRARSAGRTSLSLMMILADRAAVKAAPASSVCFRQSAPARPALCSAIEASRLARNGRDWHTLLEFCAFVNTLIIDEDGVTDPRLINDRLLLGLKGTFSELELSMFRQRSQEALRLKAARGELHTTAAIGYRRGADGRLEQDADRRIRVDAVDGVPQVQRDRQRAPARLMAAAGGDRLAGRGLRSSGSGRAVASAALPCGSSAADQSGLRRSLCVWAHRFASSSFKGGTLSRA